MKVNASKIQLLTAAAMLVLVSSGVAAYAQGQYASASLSPSAAGQFAFAQDSTNSTSTESTSSTSTTSAQTNSTTTETTSTEAGTTNSSGTATAATALCQPPAATERGRLILPITQVGAATGGSISFPINSRGCMASITTVGGVFGVHIVLRYAKAVTQYNAVLVANGTSYALGSMVTGRDGSGQMLNQVLLSAGTYTVSLQIFDASSSPGQSTLVLQTAQGTIVSPQAPTSNSTQLSNHDLSSGRDK